MQNCVFIWRVLFVSSLLWLVAGCADSATPVRVAARYPHDPGAFTEGLLIENGKLYESTGLYDASSLRREKLTTGQVELERRLPGSFFGEGLAVFDGRLYQLTWKSGVVQIYNLHTFKPIGQLSYQGEGWGLTRCGSALVMSNGSNTLTFRNPRTFSATRRVAVTESGEPVNMLNELETIHGLIWANVWQTNRIVVIDPSNGHVVAALDASRLAAEQPASADVLNGIAYDTKTGRVYITGKDWPTLYALANNSRQAPSVPADHRCPER